MMPRTLLRLLAITATTLIVVEVVLRLFGFKAGVLINDFVVTDATRPQLVHRADSAGITTYIPGSPYLPKGYVVNQQGFRGAFNYTKEVVDSLRQTTHRPLLLVIGDSYAEGCCLDSGELSFTERIAADSAYTVINLGIGATDPLQYRLLAEKYIPLLQPEAVLVCVYLGNDVMEYNRQPHAGVPSFYRINDTAWVPSEPVFYFVAEYPGQYFTSAQEAYDFNLRTFTLLSPQRSPLQSTMAHSVVLSRTYLFGKVLYLALKNKRPLFKQGQPPYTAQHLRGIQTVAQANHCKLLITAAPAIEDVSAQKDLKTEYAYLFTGTSWYAPDLHTWNQQDYNMADGGIHLSAQGHKKYYEFLKPLLPPVAK